MNTFIDFLRHRPDAYGGRQPLNVPASAGGNSPFSASDGSVTQAISPAEGGIGGPGNSITDAIKPGEGGMGEPGKAVTDAIMPGEGGYGGPSNVSTDAMGEAGRSGNQPPSSSLERAINSVSPSNVSAPRRGGGGGGNAGGGGSQSQGPTPTGYSGESSGSGPTPNKRPNGGASPSSPPQSS